MQGPVSYDNHDFLQSGYQLTRKPRRHDNNVENKTFNEQSSGYTRPVHVRDETVYISLQSSAKIVTFYAFIRTWTAKTNFLFTFGNESCIHILKANDTIITLLEAVNTYKFTFNRRKCALPVRVRIRHRASRKEWLVPRVTIQWHNSSNPDYSIQRLPALVTRPNNFR